jgi:hypothetical protein
LPHKATKRLKDFSGKLLGTVYSWATSTEPA